MVLSAHLALVNVTLAADASQGIPDPDAEDPPKSVRRKAYRSHVEFREMLDEMRASPVSYIRRVGYAELFDLEPMEREKQKTIAERVADGKAAARRAVSAIAASLRG